MLFTQGLLTYLFFSSYGVLGQLASSYGWTDYASTPVATTCRITQPGPCSAPVTQTFTVDLRSYYNYGPPFTQCGTTEATSSLGSLMSLLTGTEAQSEVEGTPNGDGAEGAEWMMKVSQSVSGNVTDELWDMSAKRVVELKEENLDGTSVIGVGVYGACLSAQPGNLGTNACECISGLQRRAREVSKCQLVDLVVFAISCSGILGCVTHNYSAASSFTIPYSEPAYLSLPLLSVTSTPATITADTVSREGPTYYLLWKAIEFAHSWTDTIYCSRNYPGGILPGWSSLAGIVTFQTAVNIPSTEVLPFVTIATYPSAVYPGATDILIAFRGTVSNFEWRVDFEYELTQLTGLPGRVHIGFAHTATAVYSKILQALQRVPKIGVITLTGHSMGGAISSIVAYKLSQNYGSQGGELRVRCIMFGSSKAGDATYVAALGRSVNLRWLIGENDVVPTVLCPQMPTCPIEYARVPTGPLGGRVAYADYPGKYVIRASDLGQEWTVPAKNLDILSWHMCGYKCFTTRWFAPADPISYCGVLDGSDCPFTFVNLAKTVVERAV